MVQSLQLQATHCRQKPAWKAQWQDVKGNGGTSRRAGRHAPKSENRGVRGILIRCPQPGRYGMSYKQSDTPPVLAPGCEELKCDVVGISKRQCRIVGLTRFDGQIDYAA